MCLKKKKKYRTSIIHGQILPQHFHYIHFTQLIDQRNPATEKYHKKDGSRTLKVDFQSRLIYSLRKQKTFTHVHVNKIEAIHEVSRCVYVYSRSSMHCLCFIYARKIYLRTHVNWLDSVNPPYKGIREKEKHHFHRYPFTTHQLLFESFTSFLWLVKLKLHVLGFIFWLKISKLPTSI